MAEITLKKSLASDVQERAKSKKCLHCERAAAKRGLCNAHYMDYRRKRAAEPRSERKDFELRMIRSGKILVSGGIRELLDDSPFAE